MTDNAIESDTAVEMQTDYVISLISPKQLYAMHIFLIITVTNLF